MNRTKNTKKCNIGVQNAQFLFDGHFLDEKSGEKFMVLHMFSFRIYLNFTSTFLNKLEKSSLPSLAASWSINRMTVPSGLPILYLDL